MSTQPRKAALLASLGAGFEYYDFIIYGMMANYLSTLFFVEDVPWVILMKTFAVFAVGYLARSFGGIFFGMFGDTYGRKKTFLCVMLLMGIATFSIGLLPTYEQIGVLAPASLVFFRILQGLSFGAELPGAMTVAYEYALEKKRGIYSMYVLASTSIGALLASFILYCLTSVFPENQILSWGWRIPFLFGGLLIVANYLIRRNLDETPEFILWQKTRSQTASLKDPFTTLSKAYKGRLIQGIGLTSFVSSLVMTGLYFPTYLTVYFGYQPAEVYLTIFWSLLWSALILPFCGWLADTLGKKCLFISTLLIFIVAIFPLFGLLEKQSFAALQLFLVLYQTLLGLASACYFPLLGDLFPTNVRYTGTATCYNLTYSLMAMLPAILTGLIHYHGTVFALVWVLLGFALITFVSILFHHYFLTLPEKTKSV
jgi:MHS family proline/betaine transporter-like MFS transporter